MVVYLKKTRSLIQIFLVFIIEVIPRAKNSHVNALAKLASTEDAELLSTVSVKFLVKPNINQQPMKMELDQQPLWMDPILAHLKMGELSNDKTEAKILRIKVARYVIYDDKLYRRGYSMPLLRCVVPLEADYTMREIYAGICGNYAKGQSLSFKALR